METCIQVFIASLLVGEDGDIHLNARKKEGTLPARCIPRSKQTVLIDGVYLPSHGEKAGLFAHIRVSPPL